MERFGIRCQFKNILYYCLVNITFKIMDNTIQSSQNVSVVNTGHNPDISLKVSTCCFNCKYYDAFYCKNDENYLFGFDFISAEIIAHPYECYCDMFELKGGLHEF